MVATLQQSDIKLHFENLGSLDSGDLELADLTVICGENNTGKKYITYTLYGLLSRWKQFLWLPSFNLAPLRRYGAMEIDLKKEIVARADEILARTIDAYCANLHRVLASQPERFAETRLQMFLNFNDVLDRGYDDTFTTEDSRRIISCTKQPGDPVLVVNALAERDAISVRPFNYQPFLERSISEICFEPLLPRPFIVSTERTGAVTFQGELNLARNRMVELAGNIDVANLPDPSSLLESVYGAGYPWPVSITSRFSIR